MSEDTFKFSYKNKSTDDIGLSVYNSGFQKCTPGYRWGPGMRDHYLIHHIISGKGTLHVEDEVYSLSAGDTFLVYPSTLVSYEADEKEPWEYCWVGFNGSQAALLISQMDFSPERPVLHTDFGDQLRQELMQIYQTRGSEPYHLAAMTGHLYLALSALLEHSSYLPQNRSQGQMYVENACRYISHNYARRIDVEDISRNVGVSRSNLFRSFMKYMRMSPNQYLMNFRINMACALLESGKLSIAQVANSVGYEDQMYFSRVFRKIKKMSPRAYVKMKLSSQ